MLIDAEMRAIQGKLRVCQNSAATPVESRPQWRKGRWRTCPAVFRAMCPWSPTANQRPTSSSGLILSSLGSWRGPPNLQPRSLGGCYASPPIPCSPSRAGKLAGNLAGSLDSRFILFTLPAITLEIANALRCKFSPPGAVACGAGNCTSRTVKLCNDTIPRFVCTFRACRPAARLSSIRSPSRVTRWRPRSWSLVTPSRMAEKETGLGDIASGNGFAKRAWP